MICYIDTQSQMRMVFEPFYISGSGQKIGREITYFGPKMDEDFKNA